MIRNTAERERQRLALSRAKRRAQSAGFGSTMLSSLTWSASSFQPNTLSGLVLWLDSTSGVTTSGTDVTAWSDRSGAGNNFGNSDGVDEPTLVSSVFGSKPAVRIGNFTYVYRTGGGSVSFASGLTVFAAFKGYTTNRNSIVCGDRGTATAAFEVNVTTSGLNFVANGGVISHTSAMTLTDGNFHTVAVTWATDGTLIFYEGGGVDTSTSYSYVTSDFDQIGDSDNSGNVDLAEVVAYSGVKTGAEITQLHNRAVSLWS